MRTKSNPRIKDIANMAGVSIGTVDRVLHNRGEVAQETREKILKIATELNYSPNLMARALKTKRKFQLVSMLPEATDDNPFWYKHQQGIDRALSELAPYPVGLMTLNFDGCSETDFRKKTDEILKMAPDGVLLAPVFKQESIAFCQQLCQLHIPFVFVDTFINEVDYLAFVGEDAYQSGRVAAQLIDFGTDTSKDILIVNIARDLENTLHLNSRMQGFQSYFLDAGKNEGLKISLELPSSDYQEVKLKLDQVLTNNPNIGAVFVTSSKTYLIARYLEQENKKSIHLVGYDIVDRSVRYLRTGHIRFLIGQRPAEQAERALKKLFDFLVSNRVTVKTEYLPIDVIMSENINFFI
jgi:LacI family transcriptional regulator